MDNYHGKGHTQVERPTHWSTAVCVCVGGGGGGYVYVVASTSSIADLDSQYR